MRSRPFITISLLVIIGIAVFNVFSTIPKGASAVTHFQKQRYLGKWYEVARMDFRFERNLNNTTAEYSINKDGSIRVVNRGFNYVKNKWKQAVGKARFVGDDTVGMLKVSFFGPFYGSYNVIALDEDYNYALIAGKNLDYLWILSRTTTLPESIKQRFINKAKHLGYKTDALLWIEHSHT